MNLIILGVIGPYQLILLLLIIGIVIVLPIVLLVRSAKHKARAKAMEEFMNKKSEKQADPLDKIAKLQALRQSGALSDAEFEEQKKKILAD